MYTVFFITYTYISLYRWWHGHDDKFHIQHQPSQRAAILFTIESLHRCTRGLKYHLRKYYIWWMKYYAYEKILNSWIFLYSENYFRGIGYWKKTVWSWPWSTCLYLQTVIRSRSRVYLINYFFLNLISEGVATSDFRGTLLKIWQNFSTSFDEISWRINILWLFFESIILIQALKIRSLQVQRWHRLKVGVV